MYFSSASKELRALLPPAVQQQLRADYEEAAALLLTGSKVGNNGSRFVTHYSFVRVFVSAFNRTTDSLCSVLTFAEVTTRQTELTPFRRAAVIPSDHALPP